MSRTTDSECLWDKRREEEQRLKLKKRLFTKRKCYCGSRYGHHFDYHRDGHYAICNARQHEIEIGEPWAPTMFDFFCACGGLFIASQNLLVLSTGIPICCDFRCPACATRWRITCPPDESEGLILALSLNSELQAAAAELADMMDDAENMLALSEGAPESGLKRFVRNLFSRWPEPIIPPDDMPEKQRYLANVLELRHQFQPQILQEKANGLLVWCDT